MTYAVEKETPLDPRTGMLLLVLINMVIFLKPSLYIEIMLIASLTLLLFICGCKKEAIKWVLAFGILIAIQYYILPIMPKMIEEAFVFLPMYFRKFFPCLMVGTLMVKKIPAKNFVTALQKCKVPWQIIVPLSIALRYFPTIKEETRHIKEAMKLRDIKGTQRMEYLMVAMIVSATNAAEELSAAAVTRGIENPCPKTSIVSLKLKGIDYLSVAFSIGLVCAAVI